jgi:hypothetical protein
MFPRIKAGRALAGGLVGALVVSAVTGVLRFVGVPLNIEMMLGSLVLGMIGPGVWLLGLGMHLVAGAIIGIVYAVIFEKGLHEASVGLGLALASVHAVVTGIILAFVPDVHPLVPSILPAPGPFLLGLGAFGVLLFLALHLLFGAIVGSIYGGTADVRRSWPDHRQRAITR